MLKIFSISTNMQTLIRTIAIDGPTLSSSRQSENMLKKHRLDSVAPELK